MCSVFSIVCILGVVCVRACVRVSTSLRDATARWRGVSHMLSLALTRAPGEEEDRDEKHISPQSGEEPDTSGGIHSESVFVRERGRILSVPERMRSSVISASPKKAAACSGVRFSASWRRKTSVHYSRSIIHKRYMRAVREDLSDPPAGWGGNLFFPGMTCRI